jgi:hypothetical protein
MRRMTVVLSGVLAALVTTGCISTQSGTARIFEAYPPAQMTAGKQTAARMPVGADLTWRALGQPVDPNQPNSLPGRFKQKLTTAFEETGVFSFNPEKLGNEHYTLVLTVDNNGKMGLAILTAVFCGLTLTILPAFAIDEFKIVAQLKDRGGNVIGTRRLDHKMTTVIEFFMLFGMPFASPIHAGNKMLTTISRDLAVWTWETIRNPTAAPPPAPADAVPPPPPDAVPPPAPR